MMTSPAHNNFTLSSKRNISLVCLLLLVVFSSFIVVSGVHNTEVDVCQKGTVDSDCPDYTPYLCKAQFSPFGDGSCFSDGLCCCESRDGTFQSTCNDDDICCDGSCCDEKTSFCCGGACCNAESEVCCDGECVGLASFGIRVWVPVIMNGALAIIFYCMIIKAATTDVRAGRLGIFMLFMTLWGVVQMVVARSAWDCSRGLTIVFWVGAGEAGLGFFLVFLKIIKAAVSGESIFADFTLERLVIALVDQQGNIQGVVVADQQKMQITREHLARTGR